MKKKIFSLIAVFAMAFTALVFTSCSKSSDDEQKNALNGTTWSGNTTTAYICGRMSDQHYAYPSAEITFTSNTTCKFHLDDGAGEMWSQWIPTIDRGCTYTISADGKTVTLTDSTNPDDFVKEVTISGNMMTFSYGDYGTFNLKKY